MSEPAESPVPPDQPAQQIQERHASWIELFFDLVVVAGIGQLAHLLHGEPTAAGVGQYVLLYFAFWVAWASYMMYGNVAGESTRTGTLLVGMFGMSVMTAAVTGLHDGHATAFALAYVFVRVMAGRVWRRGQVVVDWPIAQMAVGVIPWIVSLWMDDPVRYWLWALGLTLDMLIMFTVSGQRLVDGAQERLQQVAVRRGRREERARAAGLSTTVSEARSDRAHLTERLGLYIIIVLGEGVIQVITGAAEISWDGALMRLALGAFLLLVGIWALSLLHGHAGVPHLDPTRLPVRISMALHCFSTCAIAALAAGLGAAVEHAHDDHVPQGALWLICASTAIYFAIAGIAGLATRTDGRWLLACALPGTVLPLVLALFGGGLTTVAVVWAVAIIVYWPVVYERRSAQRAMPPTSAARV